MTFGYYLGGSQADPILSTEAIHYGVATASHVTVEVLDAHGARVRLLAQGPHQPGEHRLMWDGRSDAGTQAAAGLYTVRLTAYAAGGRAFIQTRLARLADG